MCPVILLPIHKGTKVYFYHAVLPFCLPVFPRLERGEESSLDTEKITEQKPELGHKNCSAIIDDGVQEVVILYHQVYNYFCQFWSINGDFD